MWPGASSSGPLGLGCVKFHHGRYERVRKKASNTESWLLGLPHYCFYGFAYLFNQRPPVLGAILNMEVVSIERGKCEIFVLINRGNENTSTNYVWLMVWVPNWSNCYIARFCGENQHIRWFTPSSFPIFCGFSSTLFCWLNSHFWWWKSTRFIVHGKYA